MRPCLRVNTTSSSRRHPCPIRREHLVDAVELRLSERGPTSRRCSITSLIEGVSVEAIAVREFSTGVGPADLVIVDANGSVTVVEFKLASNAEIRRTIIGQVFDYAARLAELSPAEFIE